MAASISMTDLAEKSETVMNRRYTPTSRLLCSVFVAFAAAATVTIIAFIGLLASDRGADSAYLAIPVSPITAPG